MKDWRGTEIDVGDVILYSVAHSSQVEVNEAVVATVGEREVAWSLHGETEPVITADWIRSTFGEHASQWRRVKRVTINQVRRITVLAKQKQETY